MERSNRTFYFFILASCTLHAAFWFGKFEFPAPVQYSGSNSPSKSIQVTLIKPKLEQSTENTYSKQIKLNNNQKKIIEKPQALKQVMLALENTRKTTTHESETNKQTTNATNRILNPAPIQNNKLLSTSSSKTKRVVNESINKSVKIEPAVLSQQQVARINAHLTRAFGQYFSYPRLAQRNGWQGMVKLGLRIESNGQLSNIRLLSTSGFPILDEAALNALNRVSTLQDVDIWLDGLHLDTVLPVQYKLVDS